MRIITSSENRTVKNCIQLKQKKFRDKQRKYVIEGPNLLKEALRYGVEIDCILVKNSALETEEIQNIINLCSDLVQDSQVFVVSDKVFDKLADTESPQGIYGVVHQKKLGEEKFFEMVGKGNVLVLDRIQDAGNAGTMIRTAEAAGYRGVIIMKGTVDVYAPKVVRAGAGSILRMPLIFADSPEYILDKLKNYGKTTVATDIEDSCPYYSVNFKENIALIMGNEGNGVCREFLENSSLKVNIPMPGGTESLNVSAAAAIIMYEGIKGRMEEKSGVETKEGKFDL